MTMNKSRLVAVTALAVMFCGVLLFMRRYGCVGRLEYTPTSQPQFELGSAEAISPTNAQRLNRIGVISGAINEGFYTPGTGVFFAPNSSRLAISNYTAPLNSFATIEVFDITEKGMLCAMSLSETNSFPAFVAFSKDGSLAITENEYEDVYSVWDLQPRTLFQLSPHIILKAEFAEFLWMDEQEFISYIPIGGNEFTLWNTSTKETTTDIEPLLNQVRSLIHDNDGDIEVTRNLWFSSDSNWLVTYSRSFDAQIWNRQTEQAEEMLRCGRFGIRLGNTILLCGRTSWSFEQTLRQNQVIRDDELYVALNESETLTATIDEQGNAALQALDSGEEVFRFDQDYSVVDIDFSQDGHFVALTMINISSYWIEIWAVSNEG
jgi:WD40 repeat protein